MSVLYLSRDFRNLGVERGDHLRRIALLLASASLAGSGLLLAAPSPAAACDATHPCGFVTCHVNEPQYDPGTGEIWVTRPVECYY